MSKRTIEQNVKTVMKETIEGLKEKYGDVKDEWNGALDILQTQYLVYFQLKESLQQQGAVLTCDNGALKVNPIIRCLLEVEEKIFKLVREFGLSPSANAKIKANREENAEKEYIQALLDGAAN